MALSIGTIVVSYNSEVAALRRSLTGVAVRSTVVICDNSTDLTISQLIEKFCLTENIYYLRMDGNRGLAYAQNRAIELLRELEVEFILFLDDDSVPSSTMLDKLAEGYLDLLAANGRVGCVGAVARTSTGKHLANVRLSTSGVTKCPLMMSSGALIPMQVIKEVGLMDESLFIGFVDFDWGWRAQARGYGLYLINEAFFFHSLGVGTKRILGVGLKVATPVRHYYQFRNAIRMITRSYVPRTWIIREIPCLGIRFIVYGLLLRPRWKRVHYMLRGIIEGVLGYIGAINEEP